MAIEGAVWEIIGSATNMNAIFFSDAYTEQ
jgi:hypothetical protein